MPSALDIPSVPDLLEAFEASAGTARKELDTHRGSIYDLYNGAGAILFRRLMERDRDEFAALYFANARNERLDRYLAVHFPSQGRVLDTPGRGVAVLARPTAAAGAGVFLDRTRFQVVAPGVPIRRYLVDGDHDVAATETLVSLPVLADLTGAAGRLDPSNIGDATMKVEDRDTLWDPTWSLVSIECAAGTEREKDDQVKGRIARVRVDSRNGFQTKIGEVLRGVGAEQVVFYRSDYLGAALDYGLNRIYVGDSNFETSAELLRDCRLALPRCAVAGTSVQVLPMTNAALSLSIEARFWSHPSQFDGTTAMQVWRSAAVEYFEARDNPFLWSEDALGGALLRGYSKNVQSIEITPSAEAPVIAEVVQSPTLVRYRVPAGAVSIRLAGPS